MAYGRRMRPEWEWRINVTKQQLKIQSDHPLKSANHSDEMENDALGKQLGALEEQNTEQNLKYTAS